MPDPSTQAPPEGIADFEKYGKHYNETEFWIKLKTLPHFAAAQHPQHRGEPRRQVAILRRYLPQRQRHGNPPVGCGHKCRCQRAFQC